MTCHRLTSKRKSYDWLPLLCLRLRYHGNVYGQRKCSLLVRDYPFVWQRHANPYDFCLLFRPLSLTHMIFTSPCVPSFYLRTGCSPQGRTFLLARCRHAFWKFLSLSFLLLLSAAFLSLSLFLPLFLFLLPLRSFLLLLLHPRPRQRQEYFLLLHGRVLPGISHIHHVITVIFSALRHVALPFLLFDLFRGAD